MQRENYKKVSEHENEWKTPKRKTDQDGKKQILKIL
jgi:hypothetical protein